QSGVTGVSRRSLFAAGSATLAALAVEPLLAGCAPRSAGKQSNGASETLVVAVPSDMTTFDPQYVNGSPATQTILQNTFDELVQGKPETMPINGTQSTGVDTQSFLPMLAESWTASGNKLTYRSGTD